MRRNFFKRPIPAFVQLNRSQTDEAVWVLSFITSVVTWLCYNLLIQHEKTEQQPHQVGFNFTKNPKQTDSFFIYIIVDAIQQDVFACFDIYRRIFCLLFLVSATILRSIQWYAFVHLYRILYQRWDNKIPKFIRICMARSRFVYHKNDEIACALPKLFI